MAYIVLPNPINVNVIKKNRDHYLKRITDTSGIMVLYRLEWGVSRVSGLEF
jgi:hypothetical protein